MKEKLKGDNGIVTKAKLGKQNMEKAQEEENRTMQEFENEIHVASSSREYFTEKELWSGFNFNAGELQLSDSYKNYKSIIFSYGAYGGPGNMYVTTVEFLISDLEFAKENDAYVSLYTMSEYYALLKMLEDDTKIQFVQQNGVTLYKITGLK